MSEPLYCHWCSDDDVRVILVRDERHARRRLGFDRWVCPECGTSYPDGCPSIIRQRCSGSAPGLATVHHV